MFEREVLIAGVNRQRDLLRELTEELEKKNRLEDHDFLYTEAHLKRVESSLRRLRQVKRRGVSVL